MGHRIKHNIDPHGKGLLLRKLFFENHHPKEPDSEPRVSPHEQVRLAAAQREEQQKRDQEALRAKEAAELELKHAIWLKEDKYSDKRVRRRDRRFNRANRRWDRKLTQQKERHALEIEELKAQITKFS